MPKIITTSEIEKAIELLEIIAAEVDDEDIIDSLFYVTNLIDRMKDELKGG